jgi:hypothetical protein
MAKTKTNSIMAQRKVKKVTSIGHSVRTRHNSKGSTKKTYRGQGK